MSHEVSLRQKAIRLKQAGRTVSWICQRLERSREWFYKWWNRYQREGSAGLRDRSHEGDDAVLLIEIKRTLLIRAGDTSVRGLVSDSIFIRENGGNIIEGNFFGTDATGTLASGGGLIRIFGSSNNLIGGTTPEARNVMATNSGINISGFSGPVNDPKVAFFFTSGNLVQANYLGTDRHGTTALGSGGVSISSAANNKIGGDKAEERNIIVGGVGLGRHGILSAAANNVLQGNYIGTDRSGKAFLGSGSVTLSGTGNIVGGTKTGAGNVIAGGMTLSPVGGSHVIQGNKIGDDKDGISALGNSADGIIVYSSGNTIGGLVPGAGNVISGNAEAITGIFPGALPDPSDYVRVTSSRGVVPFEFLGAFDQYVHGLNGQAIASGSTSAFSPQYVVGGPNYRTTVSIINLDASAGVVVIDFIKNDGTVMANKQVEIPARGKAYVSRQDFFVPATSETEGYLRIAGGGLRLAGAVVFSNQKGLPFSTALPLVTSLQNTVVYSQLASNATYFTGLAIINPNSTSARRRSRAATSARRPPAPDPAAAAGRGSCQWRPAARSH